jgi:hypothetical protein
MARRTLNDPRIKQAIEDQKFGQPPSEANLYSQYQNYQNLGRSGLQDYYGQLSQDIGQSMAPQFAQARASLAGNGLLGDSGYANRLNRQLLGGAYSQLTSQYGNQANRVSQDNLGALQSLLAQRNQARYGAYGARQQHGYDMELEKEKGKQKKGGFGGALGAIAGAGLGMFLGGPTGAQAGASIGGTAGSYF